MDEGVIALVVFVCVFGSSMVGFFLGKVLPDRHLDSDSKDIVKLSTGLIATLSALVLGLLVSSAKRTFDEVNAELMHQSVRIVVLDRALAQYGPETKEIRAYLKRIAIAGTTPIIEGNETEQEKLDSPTGVRRLEGLVKNIRELVPQNDAQRALQAQALQLTSEMASSRWLLIMQRKGSISRPMLVVMVFWLVVIFMAWGVFSPRNLIVAAALFVSALAVSGATLLIFEMDYPLTGWIRVDPTPMQQAIEHLGE